MLITDVHATDYYGNGYVLKELSGLYGVCDLCYSSVGDCPSGYSFVQQGCYWYLGYTRCQKLCKQDARWKSISVLAYNTSCGTNGCSSCYNNIPCPGGYQELNSTCLSYQDDPHINFTVVLGGCNNVGTRTQCWRLCAQPYQPCEYACKVKCESLNSYSACIGLNSWRHCAHNCNCTCTWLGGTINHCISLSFQDCGSAGCSNGRCGGGGGDVHCNSCDDCSDKTKDWVEGSTLKLDNDIIATSASGHCIVIDLYTQGITIDCQGHHIYGKAASPKIGDGIQFWQVWHTNAIKNCSISGFNVGISHFPFAGETTISNVNVTDNNIGIAVIKSSNTGGTTSIFNSLFCGNSEKDVKIWPNATVSCTNIYYDTVEGSGCSRAGPCSAAPTEFNCSSCDDCSQKLNSAPAGSIVKLNKSIDGTRPGAGVCIDWNYGSKVTFDCQGYSITGEADDTGVLITTGGNSTVKNCKITNFKNGIEVWTQNTTLNNNVVCNNYDYDIYNGTGTKGSYGINNTCGKHYNWNDQGAIGCTYSCGAPPTECNITGANIKPYCGSDGCSNGEIIAMNITVENLTKCDALIVNKMEMYATTAGAQQDGCNVNMVNSTQIYKNVATKTYYANWTVSVPPGCSGLTVFAKTAKLYNASGVIATKNGASPNWFGNFTFAAGIPTQLDYILLIPASASLTVPYTLDYDVWACYVNDGCDLVTTSAKYNSSNVSRAKFVTPQQPNRITAISAGQVIVTANYTEGGITKYATATLEVLPDGQVELSHIIIEPIYDSITIGNNRSYTVTAFLSNGTSYDVTLHANTVYNSSNWSVAQMFISPKNKAKGLGQGRANITANYTEGTKTVGAYSILDVTGAGPGELQTQIITPQPICVDSGSLKSSEFCYKPQTPPWCPINLSYYVLNKSIYFNQSTQGQVDNWLWVFNVFEAPNQSGTNIALANVTYKYLTIVSDEDIDWKIPVFMVNNSANIALDVKVIPVVNFSDLPNNFPPLIKILSPQDGEVLQGCRHVFNASVCDDETPATQLKVNFSIGSNKSQATCYSDGNCNITYTFPNNGRYLISAFVYDNEGYFGWDGYKHVTVTGCGTGPANCSDGTPINQCSMINLGKWCNAQGNLENGCATHNCPCPASQFCNTSSNTCVNQGNTQICTTPPASLNEINCTNSGCCWDTCRACADVPTYERSCSKYNGNYACERDVCGFGQTGIGTDGCDTPLKQNCHCKWSGTSCGLVWDNPGSVYTCVQTGQSIQTCQEADKWKIKYTFTSDPPGHGAECCQQSGHTCDGDSYIVEGPCGLVFRPLPFFEWWNAIIVVSVIVLIYAFIISKKRKKIES